MSLPRADRTLTNGELRALLGPAFGLSPGDDFDVAVIVETRHDGELHGSCLVTAGDNGIITRAAREAAQ